MMKHAGEAGVTAAFERVADGVALHMRCPAGRVHGGTHAEALAAGLWDMRQTARTLAALRASPAPESAHVLAWCEGQWQRGDGAAACSCGATAGQGHALARVLGERRAA